MYMYMYAQYSLLCEWHEYVKDLNCTLLSPMLAYLLTMSFLLMTVHWRGRDADFCKAAPRQAWFMW